MKVARDRGRRGVDRVDARALGGPVEPVGARRAPSARTTSPRGPRCRAFPGARPRRWAPARLAAAVWRSSGLLSGSRRCSHGRITVSECSASTTQPQARSARSSSATPQRSRCTSVGPRSTASPHLGHGRMSLVFDVLRRYIEFRGTHGPLRLEHHRHRRQDHRPRRRGGTHRRGRRPRVRGDVVGGDGCASGSCARPRSPHATSGSTRWWRSSRELVDRGSAYETEDGVYLSVEKVDGYGLLAAPEPRRHCAPGARVEVDEHKRSPLRLRALEAAKPGEPSWDVAVRRGPAGVAHRVRRDVARPARRRVRPSRRRKGSRLPAPRERAGPSGRARYAPSPSTGSTTGGSRSSGEKMSKSLGNFTSLADMLERLGPAGLPAAWCSVPTTGRRSR